MTVPLNFAKLHLCLVHSKNISLFFWQSGCRCLAVTHLPLQSGCISWMVTVTIPSNTKTRIMLRTCLNTANMPIVWRSKFTKTIKNSLPTKLAAYAMQHAAVTWRLQLLKLQRSRYCRCRSHLKRHASSQSPQSHSFHRRSPAPDAGRVRLLVQPE